MTWVCQGDGDRIEWSFHDDGRCAVNEVTVRMVKAEQ
jgi:hypothetical protein